MNKDMHLCVGSTRARSMMGPYKDINSVWLLVGPYLLDMSMLILMVNEGYIVSDLLERALRYALQMGLVSELGSVKELSDELLGRANIMNALYIYKRSASKSPSMHDKHEAIKVACRLKLLPGSDWSMFSCRSNYDVIAKTLGFSGRALWLSSIEGYQKSVGHIFGGSLDKKIAQHIEPKYAALKDAYMRSLEGGSLYVVADYDGCTLAVSQDAAKFFNGLQFMYEWFNATVHKRGCMPIPKINYKLEAHRLRTMFSTLKLCMKDWRIVIFIDDRTTYLNKLVECCYRDSSLRLRSDTVGLFIQYAFSGIDFNRDRKLELCSYSLSLDSARLQKRVSRPPEMLSDIVLFFNSRLYASLFRASVASELISATLRRFVLAKRGRLMVGGLPSAALRSCFAHFLGDLERVRLSRQITCRVGLVGQAGSSLLAKRRCISRVNSLADRAERPDRPTYKHNKKRVRL